MIKLKAQVITEMLREYLTVPHNTNTIKWFFKIVVPFAFKNRKAFYKLYRMRLSNLKEYHV